jgi:hypothetical protein
MTRGDLHDRRAGGRNSEPYGLSIFPWYSIRVRQIHRTTARRTRTTRTSNSRGLLPKRGDRIAPPPGKTGRGDGDVEERPTPSPPCGGSRCARGSSRQRRRGPVRRACRGQFMRRRASRDRSSVATMNPRRGNHEPSELVLFRFGRSLRIWIVKQAQRIRSFIMNHTGPTMNPLAWCFTGMQVSGSLRIINVVHAHLLRPDRHERRHGQCLHAPDGRCGACQAAYSLLRDSGQGDYAHRRGVSFVTTTGTTKKRGTPKGPPLLCSWLSHLRLGPLAHRCSWSGPRTGTGRGR